ncbi:MAG: recombinase family protein [Phycisphaerales bacterium]|nr:recombinase family protein [Phycisphaerales bacterium]
MSGGRPGRLRCAIYTRKSNEEGLEQAFNSLDAQREAGIDYIKSQKHQGWQAIETHYDDGGFSGGSMDRPALKALLADIKHQRVDVVVVYKVDRLSRSLHDFAQIMQTFDDHDVSFVSVTQQFNTTTSMGRLTLNMLLSFAQFEREVTGERIRDKIAATKKKGLWVGGQPPLGYRHVGDCKIAVEPTEAKLVRTIFEAYTKDQSLLGLATKLNDAGHTTKRWQSASSGRWHGGRPLDAKYLYRVLTNPAYIGKIRHTRGGETNLWPGQHKPIIEVRPWQRVQELIQRREAADRKRVSSTHLLKGKLRTHDDFAMSPSAVRRSAKDGREHIIRYYVSQKAIKLGYRKCPIKSINAEHIDDIVRGLVFDHMRRDSQCQIERWASEDRDRLVRDVVKLVTIGPEELKVELHADALEEHRTNAPKASSDKPDAAVPTCSFVPDVDDRGVTVVLTIQTCLKRIDHRRLILAPDGSDLVVPSVPQPQPHIVAAIGRAYLWHNELLRSGDSVAVVAKRLGAPEREAYRLLPLTQLAPNTLKHALLGMLSSRVTLNELLRHSSYNWTMQAPRGVT